LNILINFSTLKQGGGQNVAMNFLIHVLGKSGCDHRFIYLVAKDSAPHRYLLQHRYTDYYVAPRNPLFRIPFEMMFSLTRLPRLKIEIIYTYFGYGFFLTRTPQVCGSVDSNLYYPEIDFWGSRSVLENLKRFLADSYRVWGVNHARAVVFENQSMESRSHKIYNLQETRYIKPSVNFAIGSKTFELLKHIPRSTEKILFLCGWHLNKNIMLIPELAALSIRRNKNHHFILTAPEDNSKLHKEFVKKVADFGVESRVSIVGPADKEELASLYEQIDCVMLLSKLESFSNNIIEAWYFGRPLIVASEDWARSICGKAAVYVDRNSADEILDAIQSVTIDPHFVSTITGNGKLLLRDYPTIEKRVEDEMEYLSHVAKIN
jgi:glycosyltransferase involved in cell wall biosynthesis